MRKRYLILAGLVLMVAAAAVWAQASGTFYVEQGGKRAVVGGSLDVISGGDLDIEAGGALKIGGVTVTSSAAELNLVDVATLGSAEASKVVTTNATNDVSVLRNITMTGNLVVGGLEELKVATVTVADDAAGTTPTGVTPITAPVVLCVCNDAHNCNMSIAEPTPTSGYARFITIISAGTNACVYADAAGVTELSGALTLATTDTLQLVYANAAWHQVSTSNN